MSFERTLARSASIFTIWASQYIEERSMSARGCKKEEDDEVLEPKVTPKHHIQVQDVRM